MAVRDEIRQQRQKLKGQGFKAHWEYFWEYYKIHTIVAVVAIILVVTLIRDIANRKPYALYSLFVNNQGMETQLLLQDGFAEYAGIDTSSENVLVDTSSNYIGSSIDQTTVATSERSWLSSLLRSLTYSFQTLAQPTTTHPRKPSWI